MKVSNNQNEFSYTIKPNNKQFVNTQHLHSQESLFSFQANNSEPKENYLNEIYETIFKNSRPYQQGEELNLVNVLDKEIEKMKNA